MSNKLIFESREVNSFNMITESLDSKEDGVLLRCRGVFATMNVFNDNKHRYNKENYQSVLDPLLPQIANKALFGALEHKKETIHLHTHTAIRIDSIEYDKATNSYVGEISIMDTPDGRIIAAVAKSGSPVYLSSRALGKVQSNGDVLLSRMITFDAVSTPGFGGNNAAEFTPINESLAFIDLGDNIIDVNENINKNKEKMTKEEMSEVVEMVTKSVTESMNSSISKMVEEKMNEMKEDHTKVNESVKSEVISTISDYIQKELVPNLEAKIEETEMSSEDVERIVSEVVLPKLQDYIKLEETGDYLEKELVPAITKMVKDAVEDGDLKTVEMVDSYIAQELMPNIKSLIDGDTNIEEIVSESKDWKFSLDDEDIEGLRELFYENDIEHEMLNDNEIEVWRDDVKKAKSLIKKEDFLIHESKSEEVDESLKEFSKTFVVGEEFESYGEVKKATYNEDKKHVVVEFDDESIVSFTKNGDKYEEVKKLVNESKVGDTVTIGKKEGKITEVNSKDSLVTIMYDDETEETVNLSDIEKDSDKKEVEESKEEKEEVNESVEDEYLTESKEGEFKYSDDKKSFQESVSRMRRVYDDPKTKKEKKEKIKKWLDGAKKHSKTLNKSVNESVEDLISEMNSIITESKKEEDLGKLKTQFDNEPFVKYIPEQFTHIWESLSDDNKSLLSNQASIRKITSINESYKFWSTRDFSSLGHEGFVFEGLEEIQKEKESKKLSFRERALASIRSSQGTRF